MDAAADKRARLQAIIAIALLVALSLASNTWRELVQPDEGRYAEIPREMLASGDWVVPHLNGLTYVEKPPLQYWATAVAYEVFGVKDWVSRLWNLAMGLAGVAVVYATGRSLWGRRAGEFAALILLSSPLYMLVGQLNLLDMGLTFFLTAALCAFLVAQNAQSASAEQRHGMWLCWVSVGLGFLQKGLVAFALPFLLLVIYSLLRRDAGIWRRLHLLAGTLIVGVLSLPWLILLGLRDGQYAWFFLVHEHFTRFITTEHHREEAWWYFLAVLGAGCLPWIALMLRSVAENLLPRREGRVDALAALALWAVLVVGFFSLSGSKLAPYIMPCVPALALLAGRTLDARARRGDIIIVLLLSAVLAAALLGAGPLANALMAPGATKLAYLAVARWALAAGGIAALAVGLATWAYRAGRLRVALICLGLGLHLTWMTFMGGANIMARVRGAPGAAPLMASRLAAGAPFYCVSAYLQSLTFEVGQTCTLVEYTGELEMQFAADAGRQPLSFEEFARRWRDEGAGVALMHRSDLPRLDAAGLARRVLAEYPDFIVVEHP